MISPTTKFLDELERIMKTAYKEFLFQGSEYEAAAIGERLTRRTRSQMVRGISPETAQRVTKMLGQRAKIGSFLKSETEEISPLEDLAMLITYTILPDRDEARRHASRIFYRAGEQFIAAKDKKSAAISRTNSALCTLELFYPTKDELWSAHKILSTTREWRQKGSVDSAYNNFQLSLATKKLVDIGEIPPSPEIFQKILRGFDRADQLFHKHDHAFDIGTYHRNIVETLTTWLNWQRSIVERNLANSIPELDLLHNQWTAASNQQLVSTLWVNPLVLGFDQIPAWVPQQSTILSQSIDQIPNFDDRLESARNFAYSHPDATDELELGINRLRGILAPLRGQPSLPFDELDAIWDARDYEAYVSHGLQELSISATAKETSYRYGKALSRICEAILSMRLAWPEERLHKFLHRYPAELRFTACELGRLQRWEDAFHLLELTRGLIASNSASLMHSGDRTTAPEDDFMWIHLTHSPTGTYAICTQSGRYFGAEFPQLSGSILASLFSGLHPPGLLSSGRSRETRRDAVARISIALIPVVEWILNQNSKTVVLQPGGYLQAFPIWSVGDMPDAIEQGDIFLFQVPSKSLSAKKSNPTVPGKNSLAIQEAATVAYQNPLPQAAEECSWILQAAPPSWACSLEAATPGSILQAAMDNDFVHFAGHSSSHRDPLQSALHTYAGPLTVEKILSSPAKAQLVVLGSCESGLPQNFQLQDEYLSVQSAFWYSGANYVAGTHWSVGDRAAAAFATAFYGTLFAKISEEDIPISHAIYLSWVKAVSTLRESFTDRLDWAAFSLMGNPIDGLSS
ncbi:hypothetical protein AUO95_15550 [Corynebacterium glutamicum]|nr:hypothetical protein AUO95_15550 [Corynebacterium glutamicum]